MVIKLLCKQDKDIAEQLSINVIERRERYEGNWEEKHIGLDDFGNVGGDSCGSALGI